MDTNRVSKAYNYGTFISWSTPSGDFCCSAYNDCVDDYGNCRAAGTYHVGVASSSGDDNKMYCYSGSSETYRGWLDCDESGWYGNWCSGHCAYGSTAGGLMAGETGVGEYGSSTTTLECCGDDAGEYAVSSGYSSTDRCCSSSSDCVVDGDCLGYGDSEDYSGDGRDICCDPQFGYDYTLGGVTCTTCASGYQLSGSTCDYGVSCVPPNGWVGSSTTCTNGISGNTCYYGASCSSSGCSRTGDTTVPREEGGSLTCTTCGSGYQYDDGDNWCYFDVRCGAGWGVWDEERCYDNGPAGTNICRYNEGCNTGGCTTVSDTTFAGDAGSLTCSSTCASGYYYDDSGNRCYSDLMCTSSGWFDPAGGDSCLDNGISGNICRYNEGCNGGGCTTVSDTTVPREEGGSLTCSTCGSGYQYDDGQNYCYFDVRCGAGWGVWDEERCYDNGPAGTNICRYNEGCNSGGCTTVSDTTFAGDAGSLTCSSTCASGYYYDDSGNRCYSDLMCISSGWFDPAGGDFCRDTGLVGSTCYYNEGCNSGGCTTQSESCPEPVVSGDTLRYQRSCGGSGCSYARTEICSPSNACTTILGYTCYCTSSSSCAWSATPPAENTDARCGDTIDNDCDGDTDCDDTGCNCRQPCKVDREQPCNEDCDCLSDHCTDDTDVFDSTPTEDVCCPSGQWFDTVANICRTTNNCGTPCTPWSTSCTDDDANNRACCDITRPGDIYDEEWQPVTSY